MCGVCVPRGGKGDAEFALAGGLADEALKRAAATVAVACGVGSWGEGVGSGVA